MRIAIFSDSHISDKKNDEIRFYEKSFDKVQKLLSHVSSMNVEKIFCLGDLFDSINDDWVEQRIISLRQTLDSLAIPFALTLGNHDALSGLYAQINSEFNPKDNRDGFFVIRASGYNFIFLNTNYNSVGGPYDKGIVNDLDLNVSEEQLGLLEEELKKTQIPTVILTHARIKGNSNSCGEPYLINNNESLAQLLRGYSQVSLVLQGHAHEADQYDGEGITYVTLPALVDGATRIPFVIGDFTSKSIKLSFYDLNEMGRIELYDEMEITHE